MKETSYKGLPIMARSPEHVKTALRAQNKDVVKQFLALHAYAVKHRLGVTALYHQCGIAPGILSPAFNGTYPGDYFAISERIEKFFWRLEQKELYGGIRKFVETKLAKTLFAVFEKTRVIRRIQLIESPEQLGKTRAAREYSARNNSGRTVYCSLSGGARSGVGDFIWTLADSLGIPMSVKLREKRARIKQALEACDLVIIDEAHLMWAWRDLAIADFLDYLRTDIYADGARGVALIATNTNMINRINRFRRRAGYNVGQFIGRMRNEVMTIDPAEDIIAEDVRLLVSRYCRPGASVIKKLHGIAVREQLGHFGLIEDIMNEAWTRAKAGKKKLTDEIVLDTARRILDELKGRKELYQ